MQILAEKLLKATNAFDIETALQLFASDAVIDDVSVGDAFVGHDGIRVYFERFFVGYNTHSKLLSCDATDACNANIRLDFTGDFGHEIGILKLATDKNAKIVRIEADLE